LTVKSSEMGFDLKMVTTKDVKVTGESYILSVTALAAADLIFEVRNRKDKQMSGTLSIGITPH